MLWWKLQRVKTPSQAIGEAMTLSSNERIWKTIPNLWPFMIFNVEKKKKSGKAWTMHYGQDFDSDKGEILDLKA